LWRGNQVFVFVSVFSKICNKPLTLKRWGRVWIIKKLKITLKTAVSKIFSVNVEKKCFVERNSSWIQTSSMIMPRTYHTMSAFKDSVVVTGGTHE